ncbi:MAG: hypothetical protein JKY88_15920 [Pseudomonadales bacterium]|nr:hypothetical protein [Pseudomonadales bacterium]
MKATTLIIDLLRTYQERGADVKTIMDTGKLFDYSENLMRVSLSRLVNKEIVVKLQRGQYRLSNTTNPINEFAERWRLGEDRCKPWPEDSWICVHIPLALDKRSRWVLNINGLRQVSDKLWTRPDNLNLINTESFLIKMGLTENIIFISSASLSEKVKNQWFEQFDTRTLDQEYLDMQSKLTKSLDRLNTLPLHQAKKESFHLGGAAIALLANDPLIPIKRHSPKNRIKLWKTLKTYDQRGRYIWSLSSLSRPNTTPTSGLAAMSGLTKMQTTQEAM